ncbi:MAG: MFS transporter [Pseudochelatococcus sp.]|jgi:DHA1 family inner membrane transport protein|uniref:MFS transporter n=1 Tax=Pseudochelatococcus sp. TaxID=2020869 RepID=UPI003D9043C0
MPLSLLALAAASFCIGTTEFVIMGLLPEVAADLGVSIPAAGHLVSGYALGVVVGAPIVAIATNGLPRKATLIALTCVFIIGNVLCAIAPSYWLLMGARVVTAFCHGAYFGIGAVVAAGLVARNRRAQAVALMFGGLTLANILGVPAGTALGQQFGWRATFWAVALIGVAAAALLVLLVPANIANPKAGIMREFRVLGRSQVMLAMGMSVLASASLFCVFTYIAPLLREVSGLAPHHVTWVLLLFGVGITIGNFLGGRLADWRLMSSLAVIFAGLIGLLVAMHFAAPVWQAAVAVIFVWGIVDFAVTAPLQIRVVDTASEAPNLASSLNQAAFNLGNASGAWIGGTALTLGMGYDGLPLVSAVLAAAGLGLCLLSQGLDRRTLAAPAAQS